ncbi:hypothetical protein LJB42_002195 [Komagataella kurtzmanii]|nr:hypothetical protein LJB42_002195 [Komagataella kurtzmanii]
MSPDDYHSTRNAATRSVSASDVGQLTNMHPNHSTVSVASSSKEDDKKDRKSKNVIAKGLRKLGQRATTFHLARSDSSTSNLPSRNNSLPPTDGFTTPTEFSAFPQPLTSIISGASHVPRKSEDPTSSKARVVKGFQQEVFHELTRQYGDYRSYMKSSRHEDIDRFALTRNEQWLNWFYSKLKSTQRKLDLEIEAIKTKLDEKNAPLVQDCIMDSKSHSQKATSNVGSHRMGWGSSHDILHELDELCSSTVQNSHPAPHPPVQAPAPQLPAPPLPLQSQSVQPVWDNQFQLFQLWFISIFKKLIRSNSILSPKVIQLLKHRYPFFHSARQSHSISPHHTLVKASDGVTSVPLGIPEWHNTSFTSSGTGYNSKPQVGFLQSAQFGHTEIVARQNSSMNLNYDFSLLYDEPDIDLISIKKCDEYVVFWDASGHGYIKSSDGSETSMNKLAASQCKDAMDASFVVGQESSHLLDRFTLLGTPSFQSIPLKDSSLDVLLIHDILLKIKAADLAKLLKEVKRVLKEDGVLQILAFTGTLDCAKPSSIEATPEQLANNIIWDQITRHADMLGFSLQIDTLINKHLVKAGFQNNVSALISVPKYSPVPQISSSYDRGSVVDDIISIPTPKSSSRKSSAQTERTSTNSRLSSSSSFITCKKDSIATEPSPNESYKNLADGVCGYTNNSFNGLMEMFCTYADFYWLYEFGGLDIQRTKKMFSGKEEKLLQSFEILRDYIDYKLYDVNHFLEESENPRSRRRPRFEGFTHVDMIISQ